MTGEITLILPDGTARALTAALAVGRGSDNDLVIASKNVSRHHVFFAQGEEGRWFVEDRGSRNGTYVNEQRLEPGAQFALHHGDRVTLGDQTLVFSWLPDAVDPEATDPLEAAPGLSASLSPFQTQVVRCLCEAWLDGRSLELVPSNEEIAVKLGTPGATGSVKAALRRVYEKAGLTAGSPHAKRRELCRLARRRGWI